jgi:hypothetical protein
VILVGVMPREEIFNSNPYIITLKELNFSSESGRNLVPL